MKRLFSQALFIVASMIASTQVVAQHGSDFRFKHFGTKEGLGNEFAWVVVQDSVGFIWTLNLTTGLSRFDGNEFKRYRYNSSDSLSAAIVRLTGHLSVDKAGSILIWGHHLDKKFHLTRHDRRRDRFIGYEIDLKGAGVSQVMYNPADSVVWLATTSGIFTYNLTSGRTENYRRMGQNKRPTRPAVITDLKDLGGKILLTSWFGIWLFDKESKKFSRPKIAPQDTAFLYNSKTHKFLEGPQYTDENLWVLSNQTLLKLDSDFHVIQTYVMPNAVKNDTWDRDRQGVFWFGKWQGGIFGYNPVDSSVTEFTADQLSGGSIASGATKSVCADFDGNIWVGTDRGISVGYQPDLNFQNQKIEGGRIQNSTLFRADGAEHLAISKVTVAENSHVYFAPLEHGRRDSLNFKEILGPFQDHFVPMTQGKNVFWVTTPSGIQGYATNRKTGMIEPKMSISMNHDPKNPNTINNRNRYRVVESPSAYLFVLNENARIDKVDLRVPYGTGGSVSKLKVHVSVAGAFLPESDSTYWVVNSDNNLGFYEASANNMDTLKHVFGGREFLTLLYKSQAGVIYLGSVNGLYQIKSDSAVEVIKTAFSTGSVNHISEDNLGRLWIYGDNKLKCFDPKDNAIATFGELDGIDHFQEHEDAFIECLWYTNDGTMILVGPNGLTTFKPSDFELSRRTIMPILTKLMINNAEVVGNRLRGDVKFSMQSDISILSALELDHLHNNFSITFSGMSAIAPEKVLYRHKLEGYDEDWIQTDHKNRSATYTNLPFGIYTFRVKASNHHGVWSDQERTLKVTILPPPWRTWWAYTGYSLLAAGLLVLARRNIVQRERLKSNFKLEHLELEKAKEVDRVKTSFFTNISHEFRTPLTLIKGPVEGLLDRFKDDPDVIQRLKLVQRNSDLLLRLINQLLDLAKLESGSLKVEKSEADLFSFIRAIASSFESFARQKGVTLSVEVPSGSQSALFDKDKLETILINLVNNAIKFTPQGGTVTVIVDSRQLSAIGHQQSELILRVIDTGIGIPTDQQSKIFERFHQVSEAHKEVGTGIGLSLVKELVSLLRGTISVTSEPGKGSEFRVEMPIELTMYAEGVSIGEQTEMLPVASHQLPVDISQSLGVSTGNKQPETGNDSRPQVLVVEDNSDLRAFIIDSLGNEFGFLEAENGVQGLEKATSEVPDLIISDVMMPEMDGITMAGKIKGDIRTSHIPLILLTAKSTEESKLSGLQSGADDYLTKPFNKNELLLKVRNGVSRQQKLREKLRAELLSTPPKVEVQSEHEKFLNEVKGKILERLSDEQLSVESLAEDIGISRVQLYRKVTALTGISVNELIRKLRLQRAAQLLQQNYGSVSQVAYEVGFSNLSYFSKVFREEFGVLPSEYEKV